MVRLAYPYCSFDPQIYSLWESSFWLQFGVDGWFHKAKSVSVSVIWHFDE